MAPKQEPNKIVDCGEARAEQVARDAMIYLLTALVFALFSALRLGYALGRGVIAGVVAFNTACVPPIGIHAHADMAVGANGKCSTSS